METVDTQYFTFAQPPHELELEDGERLGPIRVAYETYGKLNEQRSNAILILHALSGNAHAAGFHARDRKPGWWDKMVGPDRGFDTDRYFVICSNILGGCSGTTGPSSPNPRTGKEYALEFPIIGVSDMVHVQEHLLDHLGIEKLLSVAGGSMGGMQALQWMVSYPLQWAHDDRVGRDRGLAVEARGRQDDLVRARGRVRVGRGGSGAGGRVAEVPRHVLP